MGNITNEPVRTIPDWLGARALQNPNQVAVVSPRKTWTYEMLYDAACQYAASFSNLGIGPLDKVAVVMKNGDLYTVISHALMQLNAVIVPLNWRLTGQELAHQVEDSESVALIHDTDASSLAADIAESFVPRLGIHEVEQLQLTKDRVSRERIDLTAIHAIIYTSGTTGRPKGAQISYQNHWWGAMASAMQLGLDTGDKWLIPMPLFHVGGMGVLMRSLIYGTTVVIHDRFDVDQVNRALDEDGITLLSVVPAMLQRMLEQRRSPYPHTLRSVLLGGSAAPRAVLERAHELKVPVNQSYGMTETNTQAVTLQSRDALRKIGSSGKPLPNMEVSISTDSAQLTTEPGIEGEIVVKGPTVIRGYWKRPDANEKSFRNGWFYTGDIGVFDNEGYLYVLDRRADLIVSGGENIYPAEIESVLSKHPTVDEVAVVGQYNETWGQVPVAFVALKDGAKLDQVTLKDYCQDHLAKYKVPKMFIEVPSLPRNASGKLLRRTLKERLM